MSSFIKYIKNIFSLKKNQFFEIKKTLITDPSLWTKDLRNEMNLLSQREKQFLYSVCELLQNSVDDHDQYLLSSKSFSQKFQNNPSLRVKSIFELSVLNWTLVTHEFARQSVPEKIGRMLYYIISESFRVHSEIFESSSFNNLSSAFEQRTKVYVKLMNMYFSPRVNESEIYQNMVEILIGNPLSDSITDGEIMSGSYSFGLNSHETIPAVFEFNSYLSVSMKIFIEYLTKIKL